MKKYIGYIIIIFGLFTCSKNIPDASIISQEGFVDINLNINKIESKNDGTFIITVKNTLNNKNIEFQVEIMPEWKANKLKNSDHIIYSGFGNFINIGENTKTFIQELSKLYNVKFKQITQNKIKAEVVGLDSDPRLLLTEPTRMKFFFNSNNRKLYSEVFININAKKSILGFHEKDVEYREALINSLSGEI
jgi:hypothetical protein